MTTTVATAPTLPTVPHTVRAAVILWLVAVGAGVFETVLAVGGMVADGTAGAGALVGGIGLRVAVFAVAIVLTLRMGGGANAARWALAVLLGGLGMVSMVAEPIGWLLGGGSIAEAAAQADLTGWLFGISRVLHVLAVLGALLMMFQPRSNAYFHR